MPLITEIIGKAIKMFSEEGAFATAKDAFVQAVRSSKPLSAFSDALRDEIEKTAREQELALIKIGRRMPKTTQDWAFLLDKDPKLFHSLSKNLTAPVVNVAKGIPDDLIFRSAADITQEDAIEAVSQIAENKYGNLGRVKKFGVSFATAFARATTSPRRLEVNPIGRAAIKDFTSNFFSMMEFIDRQQRLIRETFGKLSSEDSLLLANALNGNSEAFNSVKNKGLEDIFNVVRSQLDNIGEEIGKSQRATGLYKEEEILKKGGRWIKDYFPLIEKLLDADGKIVNNFSYDLIKDNMRRGKVTRKLGAFMLNHRNKGLGEIEGFVDEVMNIYVHQAARKIYLEPTISKYAKFANAFANTDESIMQNFGIDLGNYINRWAGNIPDNMLADISADFSAGVLNLFNKSSEKISKKEALSKFNNVVSWVNGLQAATKLGLKVRFFIENSTQSLMAAVEHGYKNFGDAGTYLIRDALEKKKTGIAPLLEFFNKSGLKFRETDVIREMENISKTQALNGSVATGSQKAGNLIHRALYSMVHHSEQFNSITSYTTGFISELRKQGFDVTYDSLVKLLKKVDMDTIAKKVARQEKMTPLESLVSRAHLEGIGTTVRTQFLFNRAEAPSIAIGSPIQRMAFLFKSYSLHQLANLSRYTIEAIQGRPDKLFRFLTLTSALTAVPIALGSSKWRTFGFIQQPGNVLNPIPNSGSLLGFFLPITEISRVATTGARWLTSKHVLDAHTPKGIDRTQQLGEKFARSILGGITPAGVQLNQLIEAISILDRDGRVLDANGRPMIMIKNPKKYAFGVAMGFKQRANRRFASKIKTEYKRSLLEGNEQKARRLQDIYSVSTTIGDLKQFLNSQLERNAVSALKTEPFRQLFELIPGSTE